MTRKDLEPTLSAAGRGRARGGARPRTRRRRLSPRALHCGGHPDGDGVAVSPPLGSGRVPRLAAYVARCEARPAFQDALGEQVAEYGLNARLQPDPSPSNSVGRYARLPTPFG